MKNLLYICIFLIANFCFAQNEFNNDSLRFKNYSQLKTVFYKNLLNKEAAIKIANYTLSKARNDRNSIEVANSYIRLYYAFGDSLLLSEKYIDSSITISKNYKNEELLNEAYYFKGLINNKLRNNKIALTNYIKAKNYFKDKDYEFYNEIQFNIGILKLRIEENEEALEIFNKKLQYEIESKNDIKITKSYLRTLYALGINFVHLNKLDSASAINRKGYLLASKRNYRNIHPLNFSQTEGINQYHRGNYKAAKDSLLKVIPQLIEVDSKSNLAHVYYFLGKISEKNNEDKLSILYYKKIDSLFEKSNYTIPIFRESYRYLIKHYRTSKDLKQQLYYTNRLLRVDSIIETEYLGLVTKFHKDYDIPDLLEERKKIINELSNKWANISIVIIIIFLGLILGLVIFYYKRKKKMEEHFDNLLLELASEKEITKNSDEAINISKRSNNSNLKQNIVDDILIKLKSFEENHEYIQPKKVILEFAKQLDTNEKYLSIVINDFKEKSYNNYINDLKVDYAIHKLKNDSIFQKYTISAIAEEVGFTSTQAFTKAFYKKTNITVSYFMKNLQSDCQ